MREETRAIIDAIDSDIEEAFDREITQVLIQTDVKNRNGRQYSEKVLEVVTTDAEDYSLGMESMDTAKKMLIAAAERGGFAKWVATKPEALVKVYGKSVPSAQEIIVQAKKVQLRALIALDNWDHEKK